MWNLRKYKADLNHTKVMYKTSLSSALDPQDFAFIKGANY